jgi:hypothetical protein
MGNSGSKAFSKKSVTNNRSDHDKVGYPASFGSRGIPVLEEGLATAPINFQMPGFVWCSTVSWNFDCPHVVIDER